MNDELTPVRCGCGGEAEVVKHTFHGASPSYGVECMNCHVETWQFYNEEAEAIMAWNRAMSGVVVAKNATTERTAKVEKVDTNSPHSQIYKCCTCGQYTHKTAWSRDVAYCSCCGARLEYGNE